MRAALLAVTSLLGLALFGGLGLFYYGASLPPQHRAVVTEDFSVNREGLWAALMADGPAAREAEFPGRFTRYYTTEEHPYEATWTFELVELSATRTRLTITEDGRIRPPVSRALAHLVFGFTGTLESYMTALSKRIAYSSTTP